MWMAVSFALTCWLRCCCCCCCPCHAAGFPSLAVDAHDIAIDTSATFCCLLLCLLSYAAGFLSIDVDGRVVRVDTLAKLLGPGFRLGWVSGPPALVSKVSLYIAAISVGAASISQVRERTIFCVDELSWQQPCKQVTNFNCQPLDRVC
jgi:hypothetical protein